MRILWNSSTPLGHSGYGNCTREMVRRLKKDADHFIRIATKHTYFGWHEWEGGVEIFDGNLNHINEMIEAENFDYVFTCYDIWVLDRYHKFRFPKKKWVGYVPIDTEYIADELMVVVRDVGISIAMSKHGKRELEKIGIKNVIYAPLGVDTDIFKPDLVARENERKFYNWTDDNFVIGLVGMNYVDDRKGIIPLMQAFKVFHERYPEARLYLHTHALGKKPDSINYHEIAQNLGILEWITWPHQGFYDLNRIDDTWLADMYNTLDVFCLPTKGEGFGIPLLEAQACGIPVITTNTTSGPELAGDTGWLIDIDNLDDARWLPTGTFRLECKPSEILKCLELAYSAWKLTHYQTLKDSARKFALQYDWDAVWGKYWRPIFKMLDERLKNDGNGLG